MFLLNQHHLDVQPQQDVNHPSSGNQPNGHLDEHVNGLHNEHMNNAADEHSSVDRHLATTPQTSVSGDAVGEEHPTTNGQSVGHETHDGAD